MIEKRIFKLSPIGKKLVWPYHVLGGHLGFWATGPKVPRYLMGTHRFLIPKGIPETMQVVPGCQGGAEGPPVAPSL